MHQTDLGLNLSTKRARKREFLAQVGRGVPWADLVALIAPYAHEGKKGRPPIAVQTMLRDHFMQQWFTLSDTAMEKALHDVPLFRESAELHWDQRLVSTFKQLGVTDLHLSHATTDIEPVREGWALRIHSWPLIAPNIELPERRVGLIIGKPVEQKRYLASFIDAHMQHFRRDVRVRLFEATQASGHEDILVDLGSEWYFKKVVYKEPVHHKPLAEAETDAVETATRRYNKMLNDSIFSLCLKGEGPNTLQPWESPAVWAIPVVMAPKWVPACHLKDACVFIDESDSAALLTHLSATSPAALVEK